MAKVSGSSSQTFGPSLSVDESTEVSKENGNTKSKTLPSQFHTSVGSTLHSLSSVSTRPDAGIHELSPVLALIVGKVGCVLREWCQFFQLLTQLGQACKTHYICIVHACN